MNSIKNDNIDLTIILTTILNIVIGVILLKASAEGHSPFGFYSSIFIPLITTGLYIYRYNKFKNKHLKKEGLKKLFKPSIDIIIIVLILMLILMFSIGFRGFDLEYLYFFGVIMLIFLVPNLIIQFIYYIIFKKIMTKNTELNQSGNN